MKLSHLKFFSKREKKEKRVIKLNGGIEIELPTKLYSIKDKREKGGLICLCYRGVEISSFGNGVAAQTIERYALGYEFNLRERKRKGKEKEGKNMVKRRKKMRGFMEAIEERNDSIKQKRLENKENKIIFFDRKCKRSGRW